MAQPSTRKLHQGDTLSDLVRSHIREGILRGQYRSGERLREAEIASRVGVSRSPVREAVKVLEDEGLITLEPWSGLRIASFSRLQMLEILAYREILEGLAAELACDRVSKAALQELERLAGDEFTSMTKEERQRRDREFHKIIYESSDNEYLLESIDRLGAFLILLPAGSVDEPARAASILCEHRSILRALHDRDPSRARDAAKLHAENDAAAVLPAIIELDLELGYTSIK